MNLEDEKMDFPPFSKKKIFKVMAVLTKKNFFLLKSLKDEKMNFPPFSKIKNFLSWHIKNQSRGMTKKNFFLLEMNLEYEKMDFPLFLKKKIF